MSRRQLLHLRAAEAAGGPVDEDELYSERFLVRRPLMQAIAYDGPTPPVLLIDEVDRGDDEFEAFLLEILADYTVTVPELGTISGVLRSRAGTGVPSAYVYAMNVARIVMLLFVGRHQQRIFEFMHVYFWQVTMIAMVASVWLGWVLWVVRDDGAAGRAGGEKARG